MDEIKHEIGNPETSSEPDTEKGLWVFLQQAEHTLNAVLDEPGYEKYTSILFDTSSVLDSFTARDLHLHPGPKFSRTLLLRAKGTFYGAARLVLSGQLPESYMLARGALEAALFAYIVHSNPLMQRVWEDRHISKEDFNKAKRYFSARVAFDLIKQAPPVADANLEFDLSNLYEDLIDWGAHPNFLSVAPHTEVNRTIVDVTDDFVTIETSGSIKFINTDPQLMHRFIRRVIQTGIAILRLYAIIEPQCADELGAPQWLEDATSALWRNEIHPPRRFD